MKVFEESLNNPKESPTLNYFMKFLENRYLVLDSINEKKVCKLGNFNHVAENTKKCNLCQGEHYPNQYKQFEKMSIFERNNYIR